MAGAVYSRTRKALFSSAIGILMKVRTRFAPSPTGFLHVGGARTALFCWLYARHTAGQFILRVEDTDRERSTPESVQAILDAMAWLGLDYDEGPFYQTERMDRYRHYIERLLEAGKAYYCYCSKERLDEMREAQREKGEKPRYDGRCRVLSSPPPHAPGPVIRFKNPPDGDVVVSDQIRGEMRFANAELDDLIIARPDGTPTYNFTVVVDDYEMEITHVIRGDDHINNTPRQQNILQALDAPLPTYAHVPMILGQDGQRLSKRHGAVSVMQFKEDGFLPKALLNYLARLGWSHGDQEIFTLDELVDKFDLVDVNRAASVFDTEKLSWLNAHYIQTEPATELASILGEQLTRALGGATPATPPSLIDTVEVQRDRAKTMVEMAQKSLFAYQEFDEFDKGAAKKHLRPVALEPLSEVRSALAQVGGWQPEQLHEAVLKTADRLEVKLGRLAQPLRVALTGSGASPSIEKTLQLVGRDRSLSRIDKALGFIRDRAASA